eukprot:CAMPEP_0119319764 /NCGR_PEP_ID=MMETSP1333-20130426/50320_1 /TAXON_ID=418940 /ORGANISM="Scyphosphaera apsteinii, Strain RCC1455" /LENGTH=396 /DNA_ID=CAMNT_0007326257 /DNA_START=111 /DNA_END=1301 /DNA_ORIENTATION=+
MDTPAGPSGQGDAVMEMSNAAAVDPTSRDKPSKAAQRQRDFERLSDALAHSDIRQEDLQMIENLGHGSSGVVQKVLHTPSDSVLALKVIPVNADEVVRKSILLELKTLHESLHPSIVSFFGAFYREGAVHIALEYMDASLQDLRRSQGSSLPEPILRAIACPVLHGLSYLHRERHIIHRDIKPSNILVDAACNIKIADFGVSGELSCTLSKCASWVGTMHYMSPERITASAYSYDSDVWSLGITVLELATGVFPYAPTPRPQRLGFWDLLDFIVESPPPSPPASFSHHFHMFIGACLQKRPECRSSATDLLAHPFLTLYSDRPTEVKSWIREALNALPPRGQASACHATTDTAQQHTRGQGGTWQATDTWSASAATQQQQAFGPLVLPMEDDMLTD